MAIECNQIAETAAYLQQKFESCAQLEAADMDLLVDLISAVYSCADGNLTQDNMFLQKDLGTYNDSDSQVLARMNELTPYTVGETQIVLFTGHRSISHHSIRVKRPERWVMLSKGKDTYGLGETQLTSSDVILLNPADKRVTLLIDIIEGLTHHETRILKGNIEWVGGLTFQSTPIVFLFEGELFTVPPTTVTLSDADPDDPRIDVFAVGNNDDGPQLFVLEGTPNANPQEEEVDFSFQIRFTSALIEAGASTPSGYTKQLIYNEDLGVPTEWDASVSGDSSILTASNDDPSLDTLSIEGTDVPVTTELWFTHDSTVNYEDYTSFAFDIKNKNELEPFRIHCKFTNTSTSDTSIVTIYPNDYGYTSGEDYETVIVPISDIAPSGEFDRIIMTFKSIIDLDDVAGFYIDDVRLIAGNTQPEDPLHDLQYATDNGNTTSNNITTQSLTSTGTRSGGNLLLTLGDYDESFNSTRIIIDDSDDEGAIYLHAGNTGVIVPDGDLLTDGEITTNSSFVINGENNGYASINFKVDNTTFGNTLTRQIADVSGNEVISINSLTADTSGNIDISSLIGDYIPLTGTEVGEPVTGNIEFQDYTLLVSSDSTGGDIDTYIGFIEGNIELSITDNDSTENLLIALSTGGVQLSHGVGLSATCKGIFSQEYYGANYDDNTYVQRKYITDNYQPLLDIYSESGTLVGGNGEATIGDIDVSGFPTITGSGILYAQDFMSSGSSAMFFKADASFFDGQNGLSLFSDTTTISTIDGELNLGASNNIIALGEYSHPTFTALLDLDYSALTGGKKTQTFQNADGEIALTEDLADISPQSTADCGTVIPLDTSGGHLCNMASANSETTYTTSGTRLNAYARVLINAASEPTVTGSTKISGATFASSTDMYLVVNYNGNRVEHWFLEI